MRITPCVQTWQEWSTTPENERLLGNVVGAYSLCGALAGSRNWDRALDLRLIYDAVCDGVPGGAIPGGAEGLPKNATLSEMDLALAANTCTGFLMPPLVRSLGQAARFAQILEASNVDEGEFARNMGLATFTMEDLVHEKLHGKIGTGNAGVTYDDATIDAVIERVSPNPGAQNRLTKHFTPTGAVGNTKIIALHTDKDGFVIVENAKEYADVVPATNLTTAIVVEDPPSHCGFTEAEALAGWEALRFWVAGGPQPTVKSIQGQCLLLTGLVAGPCRFDPDFVVPDMDTRVPPR